MVAIRVFKSRVAKRCLDLRVEAGRFFGIVLIYVVPCEAEYYRNDIKYNARGVLEFFVMNFDERIGLSISS